MGGNIRSAGAPGDYPTERGAKKGQYGKVRDNDDKTFFIDNDDRTVFKGGTAFDQI